MNYRGGMWEGGGGQDGVEWGGEWDNCKSIINKYNFFKKGKFNYIFPELYDNKISFFFHWLFPRVMGSWDVGFRTDHCEE